MVEQLLNPLVLRMIYLFIFNEKNAENDFIKQNEIVL